MEKEENNSSLPIFSNEEQVKVQPASSTKSSYPLSNINQVPTEDQKIKLTNTFVRKNMTNFH